MTAEYTRVTIADRFWATICKPVEAMKFTKLLILITLFLFAGCSITRLPQDLGYGILNNDDLETVKAGLPSYLLAVDGALITYPKNQSLLLTSANLLSAYGGVFVKDEVRKLKLINKAFAHSQRALCEHDKRACDMRKMPYEKFETLVPLLDHSKDLPFIYSLASVWTSYIQLTSGDYNSIAELARVELLMKHIASIDETYEYGMPHVYLGALNSLIPPALGGKPEVAKAYFEKAISVAEGKNLIAKVQYAEKYARLVFDQQLHDKLLNEVLEADSHVDGLTLQNEYAKTEAARLLAEGAEYF